MTEFKPTINDILPLLREFYKTPANSQSGVFHIVFEDPNYEDEHVLWCLSQARERGNLLEIQIGEMLLRMSKTQRRKIGSLTYDLDLRNQEQD